MYVTKTIANLTTYSRKPGNYNGTIIFEIDIMKKSSPSIQNSHICHCQNQNVTSFLVQSAEISVTSIVNKNNQPKAFVKKSSLTIIIIDWGGLFHNMYQSQK